VEQADKKRFKPRMVRRIQVDFIAKVISEKDVWEALVSELSEGGMLLETKEHLPLGSIVHAEVYSSDEESPLKVRGVAKYEIVNDDNIQKIGVVFSEIESSVQGRLRKIVSDQRFYTLKFRKSISKPAKK
jgi:hypothetical protein